MSKTTDTDLFEIVYNFPESQSLKRRNIATGWDYVTQQSRLCQVQTGLTLSKCTAMCKCLLNARWEFLLRCQGLPRRKAEEFMRDGLGVSLAAININRACGEFHCG